MRSSFGSLIHFSSPYKGLDFDYPPSLNSSSDFFYTAPLPMDCKIPLVKLLFETLDSITAMFNHTHFVFLLDRLSSLLGCPRLLCICYFSSAMLRSLLLLLLYPPLSMIQHLPPPFSLILLFGWRFKSHSSCAALLHC